MSLEALDGVKRRWRCAVVGEDYPMRLYALVSGNVIIGTATALMLCKRRFSILRVWSFYDEDEIGTTRSSKRVMLGCKKSSVVLVSLGRSCVIVRWRGLQQR